MRARATVSICCSPPDRAPKLPVSVRSRSESGRTFPSASTADHVPRLKLARATLAGRSISLITMVTRFPDQPVRALAPRSVIASALRFDGSHLTAVLRSTLPRGAGRVCRRICHRSFGVKLLFAGGDSELTTDGCAPAPGNLQGFCHMEGSIDAEEGPDVRFNEYAQLSRRRAKAPRTLRPTRRRRQGSSTG
jgi:hypothetical protein